MLVDSKSPIYYMQCPTEFGKDYKNNIPVIYHALLGVKFSSPDSEVTFNSVPDDLFKELIGISLGADVPINRVIAAHEFQPGCSTAGWVKTQGKVQSVALTNHNLSPKIGLPEWIFTEEEFLTRNRTSLERLAVLHAADFETDEGCKDALAKTYQANTVQSIIFDCKNRAVSYATPKKDWVKLENIFKSENPQKSEFENVEGAKLVRNLDFVEVLGENTVPICLDGGEGKYKIISLGWPGFVGVASGMNECGVAIACNNQSGVSEKLNRNGLPRTIIIRKVLEEASSVNKAIELFKKYTPSKPFGVVVAGADGTAVLEFDPKIAKTGPVDVIYDTTSSTPFQKRLNVQSG